MKIKARCPVNKKIIPEKHAPKQVGTYLEKIKDIPKEWLVYDR